MTWNDEPVPESRPSRLPMLLGVLGVGAAVLLFVAIWKPAEVDTSPFGPRHPAVLAKTRVTGLEFQPLLEVEKTLTSEALSGKVVFVNFWGPWCGPCAIEFPHLMQMREDFAGDKDFQFVSVSCLPRPGDEKTIATDTQAFLRGQGAKLPVYIDEKMASRMKMIDDTNLTVEKFGYPTSFVLDRQGNLRGLWVGYRPGWELEMADVVRKALKDKAPK